MRHELLNCDPFLFMKRIFRIVAAWLESLNT